MPISVQCTCGKTFRVKDELAGLPVTCQVCGAQILATEAPAVPPIHAPTAPPSAGTSSCPACAEPIPAGARRCPHCGESLASTVMSNEELAKALDLIRAELARHSPDQDDVLRGGMWSGKTIALGVLALASMALLAYGAMSRNGEPAVVFGIILGLCFGIPTLVSFFNDRHAMYLQEAEGPVQAYKRFYMAVKTGRTGKAFAALIPPARQAEHPPTIAFKNPKIPNNPQRRPFSDVKSYAAYWKEIFQGKNNWVRYYQLNKVRVILPETDGVAVVEANLKLTTYNSLLLLSILLSLWIAVILILIFQQKEDVVVRKAFIRHEGRWYLLDGSIEGDLDKALAKRREVGS